MKRFLLLIVIFGLFAGQASADMFVVDAPTALQFTSSVVSLGDTGAMDASSPTQNEATYGTTMSGQVGFFGFLNDDDAGDKLATMSIFAPGDAGLTGDIAYDGISLYFENDDDDIWSAQLFYVDAGGLHDSGAFVPLAGGASTILTVLDPDGLGGLDLDDILGIGFNIRGNLTNVGGNPSDPDFFHMSVVPLPGAVLLGLLGLGVAGWKMRRFA